MDLSHTSVLKFGLCTLCPPPPAAAGLEPMRSERLPIFILARKRSGGRVLACVTPLLMVVHGGQCVGHRASQALPPPSFHVASHRHCLSVADTLVSLVWGCSHAYCSLQKLRLRRLPPPRKARAEPTAVIQPSKSMFREFPLCEESARLFELLLCPDP